MNIFLALYTILLVSTLFAMQSNSKVIVLTHNGCTDGFAAAWCARKKFINLGITPYIIMVNPANVRPAFDRLKGKMNEYANDGTDNILTYSFDVGYSGKDMKTLLKIAPGTIILDHHISSNNSIIDEYGYMVPTNYKCDINKSGASLAWEYFYPNEPMPEFFRYIEDHDLWRFREPDSKSIGNAIYTMLPNSIHEFARWDEFYDKPKEMMDRAKQFADILTTAQEERIKRAYERGKQFNLKFGDLPAYSVYIVNATEDISDLGNQICELLSPPDDAYTHDIALIYYYDIKKNLYKVSLRSNNRRNPPVNVSLIAGLYGGGGHIAAAGFECKKITFTESGDGILID